MADQYNVLVDETRSKSYTVRAEGIEEAKEKATEAAKHNGAVSAIVTSVSKPTTDMMDGTGNETEAEERVPDD